MKKIRILLYLGLASLVCSCKMFPQKKEMPAGHIQNADIQGTIPRPAKVTPSLPIPTPEYKEAVHTVVVNDVPLRELLFSLARDADINLDIDSSLSGKVTLNAVSQPLPAILDRISENHDLRYELKHGILRVQQDLPFLRNYRVDYLNISRTSRANVSVSTQISATGQGAGNEASAGGSANNNSETVVESVSEQNFWETLLKNIGSILGASTSAEGDNANIVLNRSAGILAVRATSRQHRDIQTFIDEVQTSSQRQVLIEATIAEVKLSDRYQAGIDWTRIENEIGSTLTVDQTVTDIALFDRPTFNVTLNDVDSSGNALQSTLSALETFGDVSVMSSPKVMTMNNQTALLKVVDNIVYFTVDVSIDGGTEGEGRLFTYETEIHTVPVGFVMSVTPYISDQGQVTLNVRPTISRVIGQARDPNPAIAEANVISEIPIIQVREVESVLKVSSGDIAVIGGLMQDQVAKNTSGIPFLSRMPILGSLFRYQDDQSDKTELVIFIKPHIISQASLETDMKSYTEFLDKISNKIQR